VVEAGLRCIPARSGYGQLIADVLRWHALYPNDWRKVWQLIEEKWNRDDPCSDGFQRDFNIDAKLNGAYIAMGLLYGGGDFERTLEISTRCGQDSDCNPSNAGGILGVMLGYERIPAKFKAEMPKLEHRKFAFTDYSFYDIVRSTEARALELIRRTGGRVTDTEVAIRTQKPRAPKLEQWSPGIPDRRVPVSDAAWTWSGTWRDDQGSKLSETAGSEAVLRFEGVAVAVLGTLNQHGGRAEVYLDGKKQDLMLDAYIVPNTHDNVLWHTYGLRPGRHTLRIVVTGTADARSQGRQVSIREALLYK